MGKFNSKIVESLDFLNKLLAGIFIGLAMIKFFDLLLDYQFIPAIFESLTILGLGILTCGYIALMINMNNNLEEIKNSISGRK